MLKQPAMDDENGSDVFLITLNLHTWWRWWWWWKWENTQNFNVILAAMFAQMDVWNFLIREEKCSSRK